jgi:16S rRNA (guanine527-N7)-methyltransferase
VASSGVPRGALEAVFTRARRLGLVGPTDLASLIDHAQGYASGASAPDRALDLGSGAGVPGLVLATMWPNTSWVLVEAGARRATFLDQAIRDLDLGDRVACRHGQAEDLARGDLRGQIDLVVARLFGPPAVTAECAAGFLRPGGRLLVSEPPGSDGQRWVPLETLDLPLRPHSRWEAAGGHYAALVMTSACPERYPRRAGRPAKDPLF